MVSTHFDGLIDVPSALDHTILETMFSCLLHSHLLRSLNSLPHPICRSYLLLIWKRSVRIWLLHKVLIKPMDRSIHSWCMFYLAVTSPPCPHHFDSLEKYVTFSQVRSGFLPSIVWPEFFLRQGLLNSVFILTLSCIQSSQVCFRYNCRLGGCISLSSHARYISTVSFLKTNVELSMQIS